MPPDLAMLVPLGAGFGYAVAALMLKRGTEGAGPWRVSFAANWVQAILFSGLWLVPATAPASMANVLHAIFTGAIFFVGQIFTFLALTRGDVSVATPVLGSKVIFVALFAAWLGSERLDGALWLAVLLTAVATALFSSGGRRRADSGALLRSLLYGFISAASYAVVDLSQQAWIPLWNFPHYLATVFLTIAVLSLTLPPFFRGSLRAMPAASWRWAAAGGTMLALQATGIAWSIVALGATTANVLYNSRGLWSVVLVWTIGPWFGNTERAHGRAVMTRRLAGSLILLGAIVLITRR